MSDSHTTASPGGGGWTRWIIAAIFVGALLVTAIVIAVTNNGGSETTPPPASPTPPPPPATSASSTPSQEETTAEGECPIAGTSNTEVPQDTPDGVEWRATSYGAMLPYSKSDGPTVEDDPVALCYSHTPTGALLAMSQIYARAQLNPLADERVAVLEAQALPGPARDEAITKARQSTSSPWEWAAFRFMSYGDDEARIIGVAKSGEVGNVAITFVLKWQDNTWLADIEATNEAESRTVSEDELASSYVPWTAGN